MSIDNRIEYFPHDGNAADDPKIMLMMAQLGLEAYGIYWILIEYLRKQPGYRAPLILLDPLSRRYGSSREKFEAIISKFGLFESDDSSFYSPSLTRRMGPLDNKRKKMSENVNKRWSKNTNVLQQYNNGNTKVIQSRVEESRVEKSRVKKSRVKKSRVKKSTPVFTPSANQNEALIKKWDEWVEFRKLLKKPYKTIPGTAAAYNKLLNLADSVSETAIAIINQSIENEWLGFFPLKNKPVTKSIPGENAIQRMLREMREKEKLEENGNTK
jgi:hypothetical protein